MDTDTENISANSVDDVIAILEAGRKDFEEARFSLLDHGLQCADVLRGSHPDDLELQVAGLLHDVGHTLLPGEPALHGEIGASFTRRLFGDRVAELVRLHVDAKRYLVAVQPEYRAQLSEGSIRTLIAQGEAMNVDEVVTFAATAHHEDAVELRRADELAKVPGRAVPGLQAWIPVLALLADKTSERVEQHAH